VTTSDHAFSGKSADGLLDGAFAKVTTSDHAFAEVKVAATVPARIPRLRLLLPQEAETTNWAH
jgi:hypothetical protein